VTTRQLQSRLKRLQKELSPGGRGYHCSCSVGRIEFHRLMRLDPPPCKEEEHNPRPLSLVPPEADHVLIMTKLIPEFQQLEQFPNVAREALAPEIESEILKIVDAEPEPEVSGDPIQDEIARKHRRPLNRQELANKLLVKEP